jgi:hydrogenase maturation factor
VLLPPADSLGPALVRTAGGEEYIDVTLVAPVERDDLVLIHAGTALTRVGDQGW